jgi:hypothetical protein
MTHPSSPAFARLRRDLLRRRWRRLEPRLRIELVALAVLFSAFAFWQLRVSYANVAFTHGAQAAGVMLLAILGGIAVIGGAGTGVRLFYRLRRAPAGPAWLWLPAPAAELYRQQAWEAEMPMRALVLLALAAWLAAAWIASTISWVLAVAAFPIAWIGCGRGGERLARTLAGRLAPGSNAARAAAGSGPADTDGRELATLAASWSVRSPARAHERQRMGSWRRLPLVLVLASKDVRLASRARAARAPLGVAVALGVGSVAAWGIPQPAVQASAFVLALLASAAFGEWLIALGSRDPFQVLRSLPVSVGAIWSARMLWGVLATALLVGAHAVTAPLTSGLMRVSLVWLAIAGLAIAMLAVNLQITLFPQREPALRLFAVALGLALVCSLMIPLFGWAVLLAAVLHSARRLKRWWRLEDLA